MNEAGEIEAVSIPFTLGIATVTYFIGHISFAEEIVAAGAALFVCSAAMAATLRHKCTFGLIAVLYFCIGAFCRLSHGLCVEAGSFGALHRAAGVCLEALRGRIESLPFYHTSTNALVCALLTGDRSGLTAAQTEAFRAAGASHILALSGLHLGVIYLIAGKLLSIFGNNRTTCRIRSAAIVICSGFYTMMTGAGPSIVRAFIFIVLNEAGKLSPERSRTPARTLLVALTVQLASDPSVISSLGFQLSYLAMTGLMLLNPCLESWYPEGGRLSKLDPMRRIWKTAATAISCQCFTAPLVWMRFHTFPEYFILTNMLALPLTTAIMATSVITVCLDWAGMESGLAAKAADILVQMLLAVLERISGLPSLLG
ncbi:MAG: ComEC/Rec2 family competence protein [Bacteroidia bacterium]|nr:ComEC/Rec2 family competence protein [Bacteroidia bacterium]